jgi:hypothetical protein
VWETDTRHGGLGAVLLAVPVTLLLAEATRISSDSGNLAAGLFVEFA